MSLLVICEILGRFVNTLTADDQSFLGTSEMLRQPSRMQLFKKQISFSEFFASFLKSKSIFQDFEKKMNLIAYAFPKFETAKTWLD